MAEEPHGNDEDLPLANDKRGNVLSQRSQTHNHPSARDSGFLLMVNDAGPVNVDTKVHSVL